MQRTLSARGIIDLHGLLIVGSLQVQALGCFLSRYSDLRRLRRPSSAYLLASTSQGKAQGVKDIDRTAHVSAVLRTNC